MSRINDVGGMAGFPAIVEEPDEPRFHEDWEAHVFALNGVAQFLGSSYYERWFAAINTLLVEKGVAAPGDLEP
ncbi:hypothetical protein GCM10023162_34540 [Klenkia terrae]